MVATADITGVQKKFDSLSLRALMAGSGDTYTELLKDTPSYVFPTNFYDKKIVSYYPSCYHKIIGFLNHFNDKSLIYITEKYGRRFYGARYYQSEIGWFDNVHESNRFESLHNLINKITSSKINSAYILVVPQESRNAISNCIGNNLELQVFILRS